MASSDVHSSTATARTTSVPTAAQFDPALTLAGLPSHQFRQLPSSFTYAQPPLSALQQQQQQQQSTQPPHQQATLAEQEALARRQSLHQAPAQELMDGRGPGLIPNISPAHYPQTNQPQGSAGQTAMNIPIARPPPAQGAPGTMNTIGNLSGGFGMTMPAMAHFHRPAQPQMQPTTLARPQIPQEFQPVFPGHPHPLHNQQQQQHPPPPHNPMFNPNAPPPMQHPMQPGPSQAAQRLQPTQGPSSQPTMNPNQPNQPPSEGPRTPLMGSLSQPPPIALARNSQSGPPHTQHPPQRLANSPPIPRPPSHTSVQRAAMSMPMGSPSQIQHPYRPQQGSGSQIQEVVQGSPQLQRRPPSQGFYRPSSNPITPQMQPMPLNPQAAMQSVPGSSMGVVMPNGRPQPPQSDYHSPGHSQEHSPHGSSPRGQTATNDDGQTRSSSLPAGPRPFNSGPPSATGVGPQNPMNAVIQQSSTGGQRPSFPFQPRPPIGFGQALMFVLQFVGALDFESESHLEYWNKVVQDYFHPQGSMRFTLWKDNAGKEAKPFDVGFRILPRFFLVTLECGVIGMSFSVDGATETLEAAGPGSPPSSIVQCASASWTYRYKNGYTVVLRGPLVAHVQLDPNSSPQPRYLIKGFNFNASSHEQWISVRAIRGRRFQAPQSQEEIARSRTGTDNEIKYESATLPPEPVNAFGIPQKTMRCLELAESCELMNDLMDYSSTKSIGPLDALKKLGDELRENHPHFADIARRVASAGIFNQNPQSSSAISAPSNHTLTKQAPSPASTSSPIKTPAIAPAVIPPPANENKPTSTISTAPSGITPSTTATVTGSKRKPPNADSPKRVKARGAQRVKGR